MAITLEKLLALEERDIPYSYTTRFSMLYAMAVGMGRDPLNETELDYVYERTGRLRAMPSQAVTVARHDLIFNIGMNVERFLHGEQVLTLHQPIPVAADVIANHRVLNVIDKGVDKGLIIETESKVCLRDGTPLFDVNDTYFARGDGGIGGTTKRQQPSHTLPERPPDMVRTTDTLPWQALLYRLTGDRGAIHSEPNVARAAGFEAPILHGSCLLGIACREVLAGAFNYDPSRIRSCGTRFSSVFYPGERLETDIWIDDEVVSFRCRSPTRGTIVLDRGRCRIAIHE
jgi:acyl dehydratase